LRGSRRTTRGRYSACTRGALAARQDRN